MRRLLVLVLLLPAAVLPGCTGEDPRTGAAEATAAGLAAALTEREIGDVPGAGAGQEQLEAIVAGAADIPAEVTAGAIDIDGDTATTTLSWQWRTPGTPWRYETTASLEWAGEAWTVRWAPSVVEPSLAEGEALLATTQPARRGDILGAGDVPLVTSRPVVRIGIDKTTVPAEAAAESARTLARAVDIAPAAYAARVRAARPDAFVEAIVLREAQASRIVPAVLEQIPGAVALAAELPLAPTRTFAAAILGRVGPVTAEIIEESAETILTDEEVGLSGLQRRYDDRLGGTTGVVITAQGPGRAAGDAAGADEASADRETVGRALFTSAPVDGKPLRTTLDEDLQRSAEGLLEDVDSASAVVALRPSTGDILVAASGPGSEGRNTATFGRYPPGSTMKVVTALALIRAGVAPTDTVPCTATTVVDGKTFRNYTGYPADRMGDITLASAVANSCNTALISQHGRITGEGLAQAAAALGLGVDHDMGFPAYFGQVPQASTQTGAAAALIGQGTVQASPMVMAAVAASVAEGRAVIPRLLPDHPVQAAATDPPASASSSDPAASASASDRAAESTAPDEPLTAAEAGALRDMMRAVVTEGTGTILRDVPGPPVGAKTGTAEFGTASPPQTHAWMIAFQGDLAVAVFVERGDSGSETAGPIVKGMLAAAR